MSVAELVWEKDALAATVARIPAFHNVSLKRFRFRKPKFFVYLLVRGRRVVYIGKTGNLTQRIKSHRRKKRISFTQVLYLSSVRADDVTAWEVDLIRVFKPRHNGTHNPDFRNEVFRSLPLPEVPDAR